MNVRVFIISLFFGLLLFSAGIGLGIFYQGQKNVVLQPQIQTPTMPDSIEVLSSAVIPSITARGRVVKIDGRNITLISQSDSRIINMRNDAKVYALVSPPASLASQLKYVNKEVTFNDIQNGDDLDIDIKVLKNGQIEGISAVILPTTPATPANPTT